MRLKEILLIDDNYVDNYINRKTIEQENIADSITVMISPVEALAYLNNNLKDLPQLIFLDIKMPEMDGFQFIGAFSAILPENTENCNIVMLSSSINEKDIGDSKKNPLVKEFLTKPLNVPKLKRIMELLFPDTP